MSFATRLYQGEFNADIVGRRRWYYAFSGLVVLICLVSMIFRGFTFGIDFKGGALFQFPTNGGTTAEARSMLSSVGVNPTDSLIQELTTSKQLRVQTPTLSDLQTNQVETAIEKQFHITDANKIDISTVGASWGSTITKKAIEGLIVFLVLVMLYLSFRYEWKMAAAAMVALIHDLIVTAGVYSIVGFEVTPSTVIALLTILGFSLYDTVVVFDKVRENTAVLGATARRTYPEAANDALNQTIMRSINTSLIALLPVASLLFVGAGLLGAGTLEDLALAQFVGLASGAYSSIFVATPLLVDFKKDEPQIRQIADRVTRQRAAAAREQERSARVGVGAVSPAGGSKGGSAGRAVSLDDGESPPPGGFAASDPAEPGAGHQATEATDATYAASGSRTAGGAARSRPPGAAGRRPPPPRRGGRGGRPGGKRRR